MLNILQQNSLIFELKSKFILARRNYFGLVSIFIPIQRAINIYICSKTFSVCKIFPINF